MSKIPTHWSRFALTLGCIGSTIAGLALRDRQDLPSGPIAPASSRYLASTDEGFQIPTSEYYESVMEILRERYDDTIPADPKLISGAVKGMVLGLRDINSQFFGSEEFAAFKSIRGGTYPGIGVWLDFKPIKSTLTIGDKDQEALMPRLAVVSVAPGSPADKAGVQAGDIVYSVAGSWVTNTEELAQFQTMNQAFIAKKIDFKTWNEKRKELRKKVEKGTSPIKARERLITGLSGTIDVVWQRGSQLIPTKLTKSATTIEASPVGKPVRLLFNDAAVSVLSKALAGQKDVTLDLRNNVLGDFETMKKCLAMVAPAGTYGHIKTERPGAPVVLKLTSGTKYPGKIRLIVDQTTRDSAEVFALALSSKGLATLSGSTTGDALAVREITQLPDRSGFAINTGFYSPQAPAKGVSL